MCTAVVSRSAALDGALLSAERSDLAAFRRTVHGLDPPHSSDSSTKTARIA